ncbi:hypothetical protein DRQ25_12140 [Candidatus Fermentibacteria bacterium]|nr:MAG: hypothetical protein DRQ25_12140 [Candidatus Fermentibacteria bacterium]
MLNLIGSDFEVIVKDTDGVPMNASLFTKGTKDHPQWFDDHNLQFDGPLLESAINPSGSFEAFNTKIDNALASMSEALDSTCGLSDSSYAIFDNMNEEEAILGCSPEFNVWSMQPYKADVSSFKYQGLSKNWRCSGAHIHLGYTFNEDNSLGLPEDYMKINIARMLDVYLGAWSVLIDTDRQRRKLYGMAGSIRDKEYGLEYRALGNFWVFNRDTREEVYQRTHRAYERAQEISVHEAINPDALIDGINTYDEGKCRQILKEMEAA